jgi:hypothetical protein
MYLQYNNKIILKRQRMSGPSGFSRGHITNHEYQQLISALYAKARWSVPPLQRPQKWRKAHAQDIPFLNVRILLKSPRSLNETEEACRRK